MPTHRCHTIVDKRKVNNITRGKRASHKDSLKKQGSDLAKTNNLLEYRARVKENSATLDIPNKYREFLHLF
jgi:hypothetical protein